MELRDYQTGLVRRTYEALRRVRRVCVQAPTGSGKSVVLAHIIADGAVAGRRIVLMAHRIEIVEQLSEKLTRFGVLHGMIEPRAKVDPDLRINVAMIQTLARRLKHVPAPDLIVIDEAHHARATQYAAVLEAWPQAKVLGLTATPCRLDGKGLDEAFDELVVGPTVRELITLGALCRFTYLAPPMDPQLAADLKRVKKLGGDYQRDQLEAAVSKKKLIGDAVKHYIRHLNGRPALAFCVSVHHAQVVAEAFAAEGFRAASVDGAMDRHQRNAIITDFRAGKISVLASCDLISEGFDVPDAAGVLLMRPTQSLNIHLQQLGRALRPKADGSRAIILDHAGNVYRHGRPDDARAWTLMGKLAAAEVKIRQCGKCFMVFDAQKLSLAGQCPSGAYSREECPFYNVMDEEEIRKKAIDTVDGELVPYEVAITASWCPGIDIRTASGADWNRLLRAARSDPSRLAEIASARGYSPRWVDHRIEAVRALHDKWSNHGR